MARKPTSPIAATVTTQASGVRIGYARTSTLEQVAGFEAQERELAAAGCTRIFSEQVSSVAKRDQLIAALDYLRAGDTLVVTKLDRLARSTQHLLEIVGTIAAKGAHLAVLGMNLDTTTPTGKLMLAMLGAIGQFEREMMLERQREGIAKAAAEGKYKGRAPTAQRQADQVRELASTGMSRTEIARKLGIGRSSVYRALGTDPTAGTDR